MAGPPGQFVVVSLAGAWLAEDDGGFCGQDLSRQLRAVQRQHGAAGSRPHGRLLPQHLVGTQKDGGQLPP